MRAVAQLRHAFVAHHVCLFDMAVLAVCSQMARSGLQGSAELPSQRAAGAEGQPASSSAT